MRVATYNAASIRARLPLVVEWLDRNRPNVLALQETKVQNDKFPIDAFEELGYHLCLNGQKAWNGVAILSDQPLNDVVVGFQDELFPNDARLLTGSYRGLTIIDSYVPNGSAVGSEKFEYKLKWLDRFSRFLKERFSPDEALIWLGDMNVARYPIDVYDSQKLLGSVGHHPDEFDCVDRILKFGLIDLFRVLHPEPGHYTYWDFQIPNALKRGLGWRIDHIYGTEQVAKSVAFCEIDLVARTAERPSDHTFVTAEVFI